MTILERLVTVILLAMLAACGGRGPERVALDQLQAFTRGNMDGFRAAFAPAASSTLDKAMLAANRMVTQDGFNLKDSSDVRDGVNPVRIMAVRAIGLEDDLVEIEFLSRRREGNRMEMRARITYPDVRELTSHGYRQQVAELTGLPLEDIDQVLLDSMSRVHRDAPDDVLNDLGLAHRAMMRAAYENDPERFGRVLEGTYVVERRWWRWEVLEEPITDALLKDNA